MMIIGITGTIGAGKGTIVEFLRTQNFTHYSVREFLAKEIKRRNMEVNRDSMTVVGNSLRSQHGAAYIIEELYKTAVASGKDCVIESIRTAGEIDALKAKNNFHLFAVDADPLLRFERIQKRNSETDNVNYETFIANEQREMDNADPTKQNLRICIERADHVFQNNGTVSELHKQVEDVLAGIRNGVHRRPDWDTYFMELANTAAMRATCDRGRSGCVIVKDKQILVTGYVGSPTGLPHCDEVGHLFRKSIHADGSITNHCIRTVHAEQNAICQAAKRGIALNGSTLYCRMTPCRTCAMMIINCGIERVVCERKYHAGGESEEMFCEAGIKLEFFNNDVVRYEKQ